MFNSFTIVVLLLCMNSLTAVQLGKNGANQTVANQTVATSPSIPKQNVTQPPPAALIPENKNALRQHENSLINKKPNKTLGPCVCPEQAPMNSTQIKRTESFLSEEKINGVYFNVPAKIINNVFLTEDFDVDTTAIEISVCPVGYKSITEEIWDEMISGIGEKNAYKMLTTKIDFKSNKRYFLNTRQYPNITNSKDPKINIFQTVKFNPIKRIYVKKYKSLLKANEKSGTKCVMDETTYSLRIRYVAPREVFYMDQDYLFILDNPNTLGSYWKLNEDKSAQGKDALVKLNEGCNYFHFWAVLLNDKVAYRCKPIYVIEKWGIDDITQTTKEDLNVKISVFKKDALRSDGFSTTTNSAPFSVNSQGFYCLVYTDMNTQLLHAVLIDPYGKEIKDTNLDMKATAFDVSRTSQGFAIIAKSLSEPNNLFLIILDKVGNILNTRDIIYNVDKPTQRGQYDLVFHNPKGEIEFGMNAMFNTVGARLVYTNKMLGLLISRSNFFGVDKPSGLRMDFNANLFVTLNEMGDDEKLGFSWGASPTINQRLITDGYSFITASIGGLYPKNIQVCLVDLINLTQEIDPVRQERYKHPTKCMPLLTEELLSDDNGKTCGTLGGIVYSEGIFAVTFSIKPCQVTSMGKKVTSNGDNFGIILFNKEFTILRRITLGKGKNIVCVNSALFRNIIAVVFTLTQFADDISPINTTYDPLKDLSFFMLVDFNGKIIQNPTKIAPTNCDEFYTNKDGSISSVTINNDNDIVLSQSPN